MFAKCLSFYFMMTFNVCKEQNGSSCLGIIPLCKTESEIKLSDIYAVEFNNRSVIHLRNGTGGRKHSDQQSEVINN